MGDNKIFWVLKSRKFWASLIGLVSVLLVAFGLPELPDETLIEAITTIVGIYVGSVALEDGLSRR